jgi:hypothetical protein
MLVHIFSSEFSFPTSLSLFPFYSFGSIIRHQRSQSVLLLLYKDLLLIGLEDKGEELLRWNKAGKGYVSRMGVVRHWKVFPSLHIHNGRFWGPLSLQSSRHHEKLGCSVTRWSQYKGQHAPCFPSRPPTHCHSVQPENIALPTIPAQPGSGRWRRRANAW